MRRADERLEVVRIDPLRYVREARRLLGLQIGTRRGGMASDTVEFLEEQAALQGGVEAGRLDPGVAALRG